MVHFDTDGRVVGMLHATPPPTHWLALLPRVAASIQYFPSELFADARFTQCFMVRYFIVYYYIT